jgi:hypothetical protein
LKSASELVPREAEGKRMGTQDGDAIAQEAAPSTEGQFVLTEEQAFDILAFLFSSAEICLVEPTYYGTFRLVDAASRMMGHMLAHDPQRSGDFLRRFKEEVDTKKVWMMWDREAYYEFLREAPAEVAAEVKRLEDDDAEGQEASQR